MAQSRTRGLGGDGGTDVDLTFASSVSGIGSVPSTFLCLATGSNVGERSKVGVRVIKSQVLV